MSIYKLAAKTVIKATRSSNRPENHEERKLAMTFTRYIKTIGIAALTACALLGAQAPAAADTNLQTCTSNWEESTASDYCPNAAIGWLESISGKTICAIIVSCSVDVQIGGEDRLISDSFNYRTMSPQYLTLCFRGRTGENGDLAYSLVMARNCGTATDVETAVANGLPAR